MKSVRIITGVVGGSGRAGLHINTGVGIVGIIWAQWALKVEYVGSLALDFMKHSNAPNGHTALVCNYKLYRTAIFMWYHSVLTVTVCV